MHHEQLREFLDKQRSLFWRHADAEFIESLLNQDPSMWTPAEKTRLETISAEMQDLRTSNDPALQAYVEALSHECQYLPLDLLSLNEKAMTLDQVYIQLETPALRQEQEQRQANEPETIKLAERIAAERFVVILGAPGGGKSTLVKHLAWQLCHVFKGETVELSASGWPYQRAHLPMRVELRKFAEWLQHADHSGYAPTEALWCYLESLAQKQGLVHCSELRQKLRDMYEQFGALLLLDGLDEVPGGPILQGVLDVIQALRHSQRTHVPSHLVVTCRIRDYEEFPERQLAQWPTAMILPLSQELQQRFIKRWYDTLTALGRLRERDFAELQQSLIEQLARRRELTRMADNPLFLTMMAHVHSDDHLPDSRVELYERCIDLLLHRWRYREAHQTLSASLQLPEWTTKHTKDLLSYLGYTAHERATLPDEDSIADIPEADLIEVARQFFKAYDAPDAPLGPYARAEQFLRHISRHGNGVLQQVNRETYAFPHRTFQEYCAAMRLVSDEDWPEHLEDLTERVRMWLDNPQWHQVLKLAVSALNYTNQTRHAAAMIEDLLDDCEPLTDQGARHATLLGELVLELDSAKLSRLNRYKTLPATIVNDHLLPLVSLEAAELPVVTRHNGALVMGHLGDPRPGVATLEPDWIEIPAGPFLCGENPAEEIELPRYWIARYPVTNAQYKYFIDAGGYEDEQWWQVGWEDRQRYNWQTPRLWNDPHFSSPNQPVVGVSWYEALAYCRWLSAELGYEILLPTEAEWEKTARGTDGRMYPWGNEWQKEYANTNELELWEMSSVGCLPLGCSPYNCHDLAGNVWEWTASDYGSADRTNRMSLIDINNGAYVSDRGGAWFNFPRNARSAYRNYGDPNLRNIFQGFRLLTSIMSS